MKRNGGDERVLCWNSTALMIRHASLVLVLLGGLSLASPTYGHQAAPLRQQVRVVNMIPVSNSDEEEQDTEANIAVDPANPNHIVTSAITPNPEGEDSERAPLFMSADGGETWRLNAIIPAEYPTVGDISVAFSKSGGTLYTGFLLDPDAFEYGFRMLRIVDPFGGKPVVNRLHQQSCIDQPWVEVASRRVAGGVKHSKKPSAEKYIDEVYVGHNNRRNRKPQPHEQQKCPPALNHDGMTASVFVFHNASSRRKPKHKQLLIETRPTNIQDMPAVRIAAHEDGTIYAIFYRRVCGQQPYIWTDVTVVRDDHWASGSKPFQALTESGDGQDDIDNCEVGNEVPKTAVTAQQAEKRNKSRQRAQKKVRMKRAGVRIVQKVLVPAFADSSVLLGSNRLMGSNLSIAVDPRDSKTVWIAWADQADKRSPYTLHVRRSTNGGVDWSEELLTIPEPRAHVARGINVLPIAAASSGAQDGDDIPGVTIPAGATNPALAVNKAGEVAFLYQQLTTVLDDDGGSRKGKRSVWETHLQRKVDDGPWRDLVLARTPADFPKPKIQPYLGDYVDLVAIGQAFYGVFSASNEPHPSNFPHGVHYQRNVDWEKEELLNAQCKKMHPSIDPFFFYVGPPSGGESADKRQKQCQKIGDQG